MLCSLPFPSSLSSASSSPSCLRFLYSPVLQVSVRHFQCPVQQWHSLQRQIEFIQFDQYWWKSISENWTSPLMSEAPANPPSSTGFTNRRYIFRGHTELILLSWRMRCSRSSCSRTRNQQNGKSLVVCLLWFDIHSRSPAMSMLGLTPRPFISITIVIVCSTAIQNWEYDSGWRWATSRVIFLLYLVALRSFLSLFFCEKCNKMIYPKRKPISTRVTPTIAIKYANISE